MRPAQHVLVAILLVVVVACTSRDPATASADALGRGDELMGAQRYPEAARAYRSAVEANPRDGRARMKLADAYERAGQFKEAADEAVRAADLLPGNVEARLLAARLMLPQGRFVDAEAFTSALLRDHPNNAEALVLWANATAR
ncbi:MAG: tetratricopeptide repeat protein, partial [Vicinamibacterales bacterium]